MKDVFVDTSAFYAALDGSDAFHRRAASLLRQAETEGWRLITTNYIVQESWALLQNRLGWEAVEAWQRVLLARCEVIWIDAELHQLGAARCRQAGERRLSLTDCVSFEVMHRERIREFLGDDDHFVAERFTPAR